MCDRKAEQFYHLDAEVTLLEVDLHPGLFKRIEDFAEHDKELAEIIPFSMRKCCQCRGLDCFSALAGKCQQFLIEKCLLLA